MCFDRLSVEVEAPAPALRVECDDDAEDDEFLRPEGRKKRLSGCMN